MASEPSTSTLALPATSAAVGTTSASAAAMGWRSASHRRLAVGWEIPNRSAATSSVTSCRSMYTTSATERISPIARGDRHGPPADRPPPPAGCERACTCEQERSA